MADVELAARIDTALARLEIGSVHRAQALAPTIGLTLREHLVLTELTLHTMGLANAQITGIVGLPSSTVAELLAALEARGLVERIPDPYDGRSIAAFPTDAAERLLTGARGCDWEVEEMLRDLLRGLDEHQLTGVATFLGRAADRAYRTSRLLRERRRAPRPRRPPRPQRPPRPATGD